MYESSADVPRKTTIAALIFVLLCLLSSARLILDAPTPGQLHYDLVAQHSDQRFVALKAALPQRGVVGYVGESGNSGVAAYYLAQYALAPLVVDDSPNHRQVVGNFLLTPPSQPPVGKLRLIKDFGDGVLLFTNEDAN